MFNLNFSSLIARSFKTMFFVFLACNFIACDKDDDKDQVPGSEIVYIANEGAFQKANASLGAYNKLEKHYSPNLFANKNGYGIGDVLQSVFVYDSLLYCVVNGTSKIDVIEQSDFSYVATVENLSSPRYMLKISENEAWTSDLFSGNIHVLDLRTNVRTGGIPFTGWSEKMFLIDEKIYVQQAYDRNIFIYNTAGTLLDSVHFHKDINTMDSDNDDYIWVNLSSKDWGSKDSEILRYNVNDGAVDTIYEAVTDIATMAYSQYDQSIYWSDGTLYKSGLNDSSPSIVFEDLGISWYAIACDPANGDIYLSDPKDYTSDAEITRLDSKGTEVDRFFAGINASFFYFQ